MRIQVIPIETIIGKSISNIYEDIVMVPGGLDTGECFFELDHQFLISMPFGFSEDIYIRELSENARSLFGDFKDYPVYQVNIHNKTIEELSENYRKRNQSILCRCIKVLFDQFFPVKEYQPYQVTFNENKLKHVKDRIITDYIWYADETDTGFFILENGYVIGVNNLAPNGTGLVGLNYYENLERFKEIHGKDYLSLTNKH